jgi:hypothetical protein
LTSERCVPLVEPKLKSSFKKKNQLSLFWLIH